MKRDAFMLPRGIYLDGNSLGPLSYAAQSAIERRLKQWQYKGVTAWDEWFALAERLSPALAKLIGAEPSEVITTGAVTVNIHSLLATFYRPTGKHRHLLATSLDFPSDIYALQSWAERFDASLRLIPSYDGHTLRTEDILAALTDDIAVALLPTVLYRSGQLLDIPAITNAARQAGIIIGWDAAHSVGAIPHTLHDDGVDFAVWCSYKYLNAGPGAPGGLFIHERHFDYKPGLAGWWGSDKTRQFKMAHTFEKAQGAAAFQISTPSILALAGLEGALAVFEETTITDIRRRSLELTSYLIHLVDTQLPEMTIRTPREPDARGGHVVLEHPEAALLSRALRSRHIIADYREPNLLRLAPVALFNTEAELDTVVTALRELLDTQSYRSVDTEGLVT